MTAAAPVTRTPHPVLYLVPGRHRPASPPSAASAASAAPRAALPALAADLAGRVLGTLFVTVASDLARRLAASAPLVVRRGEPGPWAAAVVFVLAEESRLFDYDCCTTRTSLARELGSSLPALRRRAASIRLALGPLDLDLPDPELE